ncbi:MAG: ATP-binding cassette domain-containing protein [Planctomycetes bacterium]|jgi:phosphonate transport system ATP-binding protein|nr:ATP-binding cassette domain-containing protein [Planctomycetota bacterium]MCL4728840.1 ATP-binding cassette domain-containing protein [Planctomycetota bacterium]
MDAPLQTPPAVSTPPADAFVIQGVTRSFGRNDVLRDLNLSIGAGQTVAVIGPSGAGKTTLFRLLSAFLFPTAGRVVSLGHDTQRLRGRRLRALRRDIGVIYQNDNLVPHLRVVHNVLMGRLGHWWLPQALFSLFWPLQLEHARAALREVEIEDKLWAMPGELSGGQQQRVAIARLLVQNPRAILADEPVSQLDVRLGREVIGLLIRVARKGGATLLVNLHTLDLLRGNFERVIALREGRVFFDGRPEDLDAEKLRELYGAEYRDLHVSEWLPGAAP